MQLQLNLFVIALVIGYGELIFYLIKHYFNLLFVFYIH